MLLTILNDTSSADWYFYCQFFFFRSSLLVVYRLSEGHEELVLVVVEAAVDLVDGLVFDDPQLAVSLGDEPGVVTHDDHTLDDKTDQKIEI